MDKKSVMLNEDQLKLILEALSEIVKPAKEAHKYLNIAQDLVEQWNAHGKAEPTQVVE